MTDAQKSPLPRMFCNAAILIYTGPKPGKAQREKQLIIEGVPTSYQDTRHAPATLPGFSYYNRVSPDKQEREEAKNVKCKV